MAACNHSFSSWFFFSSLFCLFISIGGGLQGCAPIDQRTFDPTASKPPTRAHAIPPAPPQKQVPFLQILEGTPEREYTAPVDKAAKIALSRKSNILFVIQSIAPMHSTPDQQAKALSDITKNLAVPIAQRIIAAGARPIQIDMRAYTDSTVQSAMVRVNVR